MIMKLVPWFSKQNFTLKILKFSSFTYKRIINILSQTKNYTSSQILHKNHDEKICKFGHGRKDNSLKLLKRVIYFDNRRDM
jgi:hypothetical protein